MQHISMVGSGSWATALVKILCEKEVTIHWFVRNQSAIDYIKQFGHNPSYISAASLPIAKLVFYTDIKQCIAASSIVIMATPSAFLTTTLAGVSKLELANKVVVSAIKGMIAGNNENLIIAEYFQKYFEVPFNNFVVISGPCHAEEVALEKLSYLTLSSPNEQNAAMMAEALQCRYIKTNCTDDIFGTEITAVMKNIIALACGICRGIGYGDNFQAVLVSNAIQEIERFVEAVHAINRDIKGSAYLGDLLVTAYSQFSRNRSFGLMIGKGYSVKAAQLELNMIAEGYYSVKCIIDANKKYKVDLPITSAVYNILYEKISPIIEVKLMTDKLK
jgi:glycerol-3-phosphate dehydrogenase (NAD(P)+)